MRLSPSSLGTLVKCGERFRLQKVERIPEPGKKPFNMLMGHIIGEALEKGCEYLNENGVIPDDILNAQLYLSITKFFTREELPLVLLPFIEELLTSGLSEDAISGIDTNSDTINASEKYQFKAPKILKSGKISQDKRTPLMSAIIVEAAEILYWFFNPTNNAFYDKIRTATEILCEYPQLKVSSITHDDDIYGVLDALVRHPHGDIIFEFKFVKTPYTQALVNKSIQINTYSLFNKTATIVLVDTRQRAMFTTRATETSLTAIEMQYERGFAQARHGIFLPTCACDPYTASRMLCGYKEGICPYGVPSNSDETNEE